MELKEAYQVLNEMMKTFEDWFPIDDSDTIDEIEMYKEGFLAFPSLRSVWSFQTTYASCELLTFQSQISIRVKTANNEHIDIEIQVIDKKNMIPRSIYYTAKSCLQHCGEYF